MTSPRSSSARGRKRCFATALAVALVALGGCSKDDSDSDRSSVQDPLAAELAAAFRIDVSEIDVTYDYWPQDSRVEGSALVRFELRSGQTRPLFHFNPLRASKEPERKLLASLELDGEELDPADDADLRRIRPAPSAEPAFEIQRHLDSGDEHELRVRWSMPKPIPPDASRPWFFTNFDDTEGPKDETETLWPTISSPEELARHRIHLRVHSRRPYTVLGSGATRRRDDGALVQVWDIDSERPVASHTVLFAAVPSDQVSTRRFRANGVDVRIVSSRGSAATKRAQANTRRTITELIDDLGPFPMPRLQILLTGWGSGMEYYGASRTGLGSLRHELGHMYYGVSAVNRTWRDTWLDESVVVWWEDHGSLTPVRTKFRSSIGAGRPPGAPGFDESAYGAGARVLEAIARAMGGDQAMMAFLAGLHSRRAFEPFTTDDFIDDVAAAQDSIDRDQLQRLLLSGETARDDKGRRGAS
ncbi:MAG: hypothetical protein ACRDVF_17235 [Microbacterium sp.]|uniref:hypothetical protein n=1 Tax=Microbacterium sp. TaxID=51671 RepID=UPI003D6DF32D